MEKYIFDVVKTTNDCIKWIRSWFEENGKESNAVIGISGGKDSTVVAALCVEALGKDRVIGVKMPNGTQYDINDSDKIIEHLGIKSYTINIFGSVKNLTNQIPFCSEQADVNLPPRIRMAALYAVAQSINGRVANTCNLSEDTVGYATLFGDSAGSFSPISNLTTDEVVKIGDYLNLPYELTHKEPADGLQSLTDEENLGFTYKEINDYIRHGIKGEHFNAIAEKYRKNKFKTDIIKIPSFIPENNVNYFKFM